jgi:hypothetical protein
MSQGLKCVQDVETAGESHAEGGEGGLAVLREGF